MRELITRWLRSIFGLSGTNPNPNPNQVDGDGGGTVEQICNGRGTCYNTVSAPYLRTSPYISLYLHAHGGGDEHDEEEHEDDRNAHLTTEI